jgi:predicted dehydrogenase
MGPVDFVSATVANLTHPEIDGDDNVLATVRFTSGAIGSVRYSNSQKPGFFAGIEITDENDVTVAVKTDGVMFVAGAANAAGVANMIEAPSITHWSDAADLARWNAEDAATFHGYEDSTRQFHVFALGDFLDAIRTGRPPRISGCMARQTVEFNTACYLSSAAGTAPVKLPLQAEPDPVTFESRRKLYRLG